MTPVEANARFKLGKLSSGVIVALANAWLEDGVYTDALGQLCTVADPTMSDVGPLFETAMQELGVSEVTRLEAGWQLTQITLRELAAGQVDPVEAAAFLYWHVHHELWPELPDQKYAGDSLDLEYVFCWLREIWDCRDGSMLLYYTDLPREQAEGKFIERLVQAADDWLKREHTASPLYTDRNSATPPSHG